MAKKQKTKIKKKIPTPEQKARGQVLHEVHEGTTEGSEFDKRLLDLTITEFSNELTKIRGESKDIFFRGVIVGAMFGILGNALITSLFKWAEIQSLVNAVLVIVSTAAFFISVLIVYFRWKKVIY